MSNQNNDTNTDGGRSLSVAPGSPLFFVLMDILAAREKALAEDPGLPQRIVNGEWGEPYTMHGKPHFYLQSAYQLIAMEVCRPAGEWMRIPLAAQAHARTEIDRLNGALSLLANDAISQPEDKPTNT